MMIIQYVRYIYVCISLDSRTIRAWILGLQGGATTGSAGYADQDIII